MIKDISPESIVCVCWVGGQDDRLKILISNQGMHPHKDDKAGKEILKSNISIKFNADKKS